MKTNHHHDQLRSLPDNFTLEFGDTTEMWTWLMLPDWLQREIYNSYVEDGGFCNEENDPLPSSSLSSALFVCCSVLIQMLGSSLADAEHSEWPPPPHDHPNRENLNKKILQMCKWPDIGQLSSVCHTYCIVHWVVCSQDRTYSRVSSSNHIFMLVIPLPRLSRHSPTTCLTAEQPHRGVNAPLLFPTLLSGKLVLVSVRVWKWTVSHLRSQDALWNEIAPTLSVQPDESRYWAVHLAEVLDQSFVSRKDKLCEVHKIKLYN